MKSILAIALILLSSAHGDDDVDKLNRRLLAGEAHLAFENDTGYLMPVLDALGIPPESQILVFSKTSLQSFMIGPDNPRAIFFNDKAAVAFVRGGPVLEVAVQDPSQGVAFYSIAQERQNRPAFVRETVCLSCHEGPHSLNVPGMLVRSVFPRRTGDVVGDLAGFPSDHRIPFDDRWGGWYVSGKQGPLRHLANAIVNGVHTGGAARPAERREPLPEKFSMSGYPTPYSDVVALSVFEHQMHMMNLITRIGREARVDAVREESAKELVDYMLFVEEAPFTAPLEGNSGFAEKFASMGPLDRKGRSLRQLDLNTRLMRYPCSYMIYSEAFRALPAMAKTAIYGRLWHVLSGSDADPRYRRLSAQDRQAIVEILNDTVQDLPEAFYRKK
jgi:hypothetical protein